MSLKFKLFKLSKFRTDLLRLLIRIIWLFLFWSLSLNCSNWILLSALSSFWATKSFLEFKIWHGRSIVDLFLLFELVSGLVSAVIAVFILFKNEGWFSQVKFYEKHVLLLVWLFINTILFPSISIFAFFFKVYLILHLNII